jgi:hypothetical protein
MVFRDELEQRLEVDSGLQRGFERAVLELLRWVVALGCCAGLLRWVARDRVGNKKVVVQIALGRKSIPMLWFRFNSRE